MKAVVYDRYGPPEVLSVQEVPMPTAGAHELLIKVRAAAITMGDCELRSPKIPTFVWLMVRLYFGLFKPRVKILGGYLAGEVEAVGADVTRFKPGDRIFGVSGPKFGSYAEYISLPETTALVRLPGNISFAQAAPVGLALDSLHFIRLAGLKKGETILINGAGGGIGTYAVQLAKELGAAVTAVDAASKLDMLRSVGADYVIDYTTEQFAQSGKTYDVILDVVGKISLPDALRLLNRKGRYFSAIPSPYRSILGLLHSGYDYLPWRRTGKRTGTGLTSPSVEDMEHLKGLLASGHLKTILERSYTLAEVAEAHRHIESGAKSGNVVLVIQ